MEVHPNDEQAQVFVPGECGKSEAWVIVAAEKGSCVFAGLRSGLTLQSMERQLLEKTLQATGGNRTRTAELMGLSLRTVRNKIRSYGLPSWSSYVHD